MGEFQKGDRVKRIYKDERVPIGTLGTVARCDFDCGSFYVYVDFDNGRSAHACKPERLELVSAAPSAASMTQEPAAPAQPADVPIARETYENLKRDFAAVLGERNGCRSANVGLRSELADVKSERDRYRIENHEQATRIAWLERENVRLAGKAKGNR